MAFAAMDVIRFDLKLKIPEDVSVVGYDDVPPSSWPSYDLTTVKQKADKLVEEAVRVLVESIEEKDMETKGTFSLFRKTFWVNACRQSREKKSERAETTSTRANDLERAPLLQSPCSSHLLGCPPPSSSAPASP